MPRTRNPRFKCPHCEADSESLAFTEPITGGNNWGTAFIGRDGVINDHDTSDSDYEYGDITYRCENCDADIRIEDLPNHLLYPEPEPEIVPQTPSPNTPLAQAIEAAENIIRGRTPNIPQELPDAGSNSTRGLDTVQSNAYSQNLVARYGIECPNCHEPLNMNEEREYTRYDNNHNTVKMDYQMCPHCLTEFNLSTAKQTQ